MRLVLDTNVVVSALLWSGLPGQLMKSGHSQGSLFFTSVAMLIELRDVLMRSKLRAQVAISLRTVDELIQRYVELSAVVQPRTLPRTAPDPDDDVVIATAIAASADLLVTGDKGLLSVGFYEGGRIVSVREAMNVVVECA